MAIADISVTPARRRTTNPGAQSDPVPLQAPDYDGPAGSRYYAE
jgi:hypothetical protein